MASVEDVVRYINAVHSASGEMQMHKLLYMAQGWSLALDGTPLFPERVEAWKDGPVVPAVRYQSSLPGTTEGLDERERSVVDGVIAKYGHHSGWALRGITHDEGPWRAARDRGYADGGRIDEEITRDEMRGFFTSEACEGRPLARQVPSRTEIVPSGFLSVFAESYAGRWRQALDLLAK